MIEPLDNLPSPVKAPPKELTNLNPDISYTDLERSFPEVIAMKGYDQRAPLHYLPLDQHTQEVDKQLSNDRNIQLLNPRERIMLSLAAKLHDIGKPNTATENPKKPGFNNYIGHEIESARITKDILTQFTLTEIERRWIVDIVRLHSASLNLTNAFSQNEEPKGKQMGAYEKFIAEIEQMPGSETQTGLEQNLHIMIAFTRADIHALANDQVRTERNQVAQEIDTQVNFLYHLESALPAILHAVELRKKGIQNAGIVKKDNSYEAVYEEMPGTRFDMKSVSVFFNKNSLPIKYLKVVAGGSNISQIIENLRNSEMSKEQVEIVKKHLEEISK